MQVLTVKIHFEINIQPKTISKYKSSAVSSKISLFPINATLWRTKEGSEPL